MPLDFPANPVNGQAYGAYIYNATVGAWQAKEDPATVAVTSDVAPSSANNGDIWYNTTTGVSYVYYNDGNSGQWVEIVSSALPNLNTKANLDGGNSFTGTQTFGTPLAIGSGGTGNNTGINLVPTGCIMMWYTNTPPSGWLLCNGQSTAGYTALAAVVGATVPNLQGRVPVGKNTGTFATLGATGGAETHTLTINEMPSHNHRVLQGWNNGASGPDTLGYWSGNQGNRGYQTNSGGATTPTIEETGGGGAHNNLQPYIVLNYIIKT